MVRALASHQCGPGSNRGVDAICGLSLLEVFLRVLRFSPLLKNQHFQIQFDQESGRRRTTLWMCYLQIIIYLFIYLFIYFLTSSSPFLVLVTSICGCRVCRDDQCDWPQYSQHLRNISGSGSVPLAIVGSLYVSGKLPTYPFPIVLV